MRLKRRGPFIRIGEIETGKGRIRDLALSIGRVTTEPWTEPEGPTPFPSIATLREWDYRLLQKYRPFYMPFCDLCCLCTYGKCDLTGSKKGACGIGMAAQQARTVLIAASIGAATHAGHARELLDLAIARRGRDGQIDVGGDGVEVEAPVTRLVCGIRPRILGDLEEVISYIEEQVTHLVAATHTGQEGSPLDFESKVFHAGMVDQLAMELADMVQISALGLPKADPDAPMVPLGMGTIDTSKPVILVVGHNVLPSVEIVDYLHAHELGDRVEVAGICCSATDLTRYSPGAKIVGPISWQLRFIRSGVADVIVLDEQCIRADTVAEAQGMGIPVITTNEKNCAGLPDRTHEQADRIVEELNSGRSPGVLILDPVKAGEVAVKVAQLHAERRERRSGIPTRERLMELAEECTGCSMCRRACPNDMPIPDAVMASAEGDMEALCTIYDECVGCGRCESACTKDLPVHSLILAAAEERMRGERFSIRCGRGPIQDVEIRQVGGPIVLGEIPGVVAFVGCANYPKGGKEVAEMCLEFAKRRYIVCTSGCAAMSAAMFRDEEGKTIYERFPGRFEAGGVVNVGSCVSNAHIAGAAIKIASIFAKRNLRGNYEEIADYVHNRVGAAGVAWGAMSQKAAAIASGFWRLGIPVIAGPHGSKYRRMLLGRADRDEDWYVYDARSGERVYAGPVPEHLFIAVETKEEAMVQIAKLCMRPNDTPRGRAIKLTHYIDLYRKASGGMPEDIHLFVRTLADVPLTMKTEIVELLEQHGWKERPIPDPTLLPELIRRPVSRK